MGGINLKIENSIKAAVISGDISAAKPGQRASATPVGGADTVQRSSELQNLEKSLSTGEAFDATRVEEIKQAISEGRFTVNPEKVADGLLATVRDLIQARQR
jgi:negative regulator of flagellin synthesis FlgM